MNQEIIGYTRCEDCAGIGKRPDETLCASCWGTGWATVLKQPAVTTTSPAQPSERRRFLRYSADVPVRLRNEQAQEFAGRCTIIAEAGLGAILPQPIPVGGLVTLEFSLPPEVTVLTVQALVRDQRGLRHGFEFVSLTDAERTTIRRFCVGLVSQSEEKPADS